MYLYKYIFESAFILLLAGAIYFFNKYLTEFFENRPIPSFWKLFFLGLSFYMGVNTLMFLPFVIEWFPFQNYVFFYSIMQPLGVLLATYGIYKIEEETRNV
ncbi:MAG: hypothetical protein ABIF85_03160 [Nanoarchaeota archaeon]|nr:hypothetical protein [Nanoarchaeota archaeon]MBU4300222.1 hypothetical protein [Nanoarchaeota archaeon]MBU4451608.1 hypothetical protein [Nanoarchaeota archaeon]MCG2723130.1 hypothetical protein [archaeon]